MDPVIVTVAPTGAGTTRAQTPHVPLQPAEIAAEVIRSWQAGAAIAHIHVRDAAGEPSMAPARYQEVRDRVRAAGCDIVLNFTTAGDNVLREADRLAVVALRSELASWDAGSMNFGDGVFLNPPDFLDRLGRTMQEHGVKPEIEIFDAGQIENALYAHARGALAAPLWFQFVLGVRGGIPATPKALLYLVESIPAGSRWSVIGIGRHQLPMTTMALLMGGHVRVGMEDNVHYRKGELADSNARFVERAVRLARELGRDVATPAEARRILGLGGGPQ